MGGGWGAHQGLRRAVPPPGRPLPAAARTQREGRALPLPAAHQPCSCWGEALRTGLGYWVTGRRAEATGRMVWREVRNGPANLSLPSSGLR